MLNIGSRNLEAATANLHDSVFFDWGPNDGRDGLAATWAWEDAFTISHVLQGCDALRSGEAPVARCWLWVESKVADAAGNPSGLICVDVTVEGRLVTSVVARDPEPGCPYDYWPSIFVPFAAWLTTAHPDTTVQAMYDDRTSDEGLRLWRTYTAEYLDAHTS